MRPIRTPFSNSVYQLLGGNEDTDLWAERIEAQGRIRTIWEPTSEDRAAITAGANIALDVWMDPTPPVSVAVALPEEVARDG